MLGEGECVAPVAFENPVLFGWRGKGRRGRGGR